VLRASAWTELIPVVARIFGGIRPQLPAVLSRSQSLRGNFGWLASMVIRRRTAWICVEPVPRVVMPKRGLYSIIPRIIHFAIHYLWKIYVLTCIL
jgi:hypothetical protein